METVFRTPDLHVVLKVMLDSEARMGNTLHAFFQISRYRNVAVECVFFLQGPFIGGLPALQICGKCCWRFKSQQVPHVGKL